jgi:hypothetical protein
MVPAELKEFLLQSLEHERGGVLVYQTALECAGPLTRSATTKVGTFRGKRAF